MSDASTGAWHPDPFGRFELRYWDGARWTEHVSRAGVQAVDPPTPSGTTPTALPDSSPQEVAQQAANVANYHGGAAWEGSGHLLDEPILVVNQRKQLVEMESEYKVYDRNGRQVGSVHQPGQSSAKKLFRALGSYDNFMTHQLQLIDISGAHLLSITRPAKMMKSKVVVADPHGNEVGRIVQENVIGKVRFGLESGGARVGSIDAENWRAWNFRIADHTGTEVARITKTWEGVAAAMFTSGDNYVVHIHQRLADPLRSLVVASAVSVDTALHQQDGGLF